MCKTRIRRIRIKKTSDGRWAPSGGCCVVPLAESGSAVGTPPLPQGQTEEDPQGEEQNGTHDSQTGEIILQHPHSANQGKTQTLS